MGALKKQILVLLLVAAVMVSVAAEDEDSFSDTAMQPLYDMTKFFINTLVHSGSIVDMDKPCDSMETVDEVWTCMQNEWEEWVIYWIGFAVCVAVGLALLVVMISVALCTPCCRCCGNCGGGISPVEPKNARSQRIGCGLTMFLVTCMLILGVISMFCVNVRLNEKLHGDDSLFNTAANTIAETDTFLMASLDELDIAALDGYRKATTEAFNKLEDIPEEAMDTLDNATHVVSNFDDFVDFVQILPELRSLLTSAMDQSSLLHSENTNFTEGLNDIVTNLDLLISNCVSEACYETLESLHMLDVNVNYTSINTDLFVASKTVNIFITNGTLAEEVTRIKDLLDGIADRIEEYLKDDIQAAKGVAEEIDDEIETFLSDLRLDIVDIDLAEKSRNVRNIDDTMELPAFITYWSILGLTVTLSIVCFCNLMGLLHDVICPKLKPTTGCCTPNNSMGAHWLLAGVGFTFIFYWIYTLVVMVLFASGGLVEAEACRHIRNYKYNDSYQVLQLYEGWALEESTVEISILDAYRGCEHNQAMYTAFQIETLYNISEIIDLTPVEEIIEEIKKIPFDIPDVDIVTPNLTELLLSFDDVITFDYETYRSELSKDIVNIDMTSLLNNLTKLGSEPDIDNGTLSEAVQGLRDFYSSYKTSMTETGSQLNSSLTNIEAFLSEVSLSNLTLAMNASEIELNLNSDAIVGTFVNTTADIVYGFIKTFADDVDNEIRVEVGKCLPLYKSVKHSLDAVCVEAMYPLNGLWFALGWCLFFLIPSIVFSFKLTTLYRKTLPYGTKVGHSSDTHPLYDAYRIPNADSPPHNVEMHAMDNPVYSTDGDVLQCHLPRPQVITTKMPLISQPDYDVPRGRHSPPPKYNGAWSPGIKH